LTVPFVAVRTGHLGCRCRPKRLTVYRKRIEEAFGWAKTVGGMTQTVYRGVERVRSRFVLTMAASNLARLPRLLDA
ncbi:transposase, partial [Limimaricola sp. G21655-S1]|uniref:transposase n=1 Tax=Limimaricola sp. G21655-S1 TaxID=3014768 RepID=UPI0022AF2BEC